MQAWSEIADFDNHCVNKRFNGNKKRTSFKSNSGISEIGKRLTQKIIQGRSLSKDIQTVMTPCES